MKKTNTKNQHTRSIRAFRRLLLLLLFVGCCIYSVRQNLEIVDPQGDFGIVQDVKTSIEEAENNQREDNSAGSDLLEQIPEYSGTPTFVLNGNKPEFSEEEYLKAESEYISLSELDSLGRCGTCEASLSKDMLAPAEERGDISSVTPSGWNQAAYPDVIETTYLYHRSHLIAYMFSGLNAEPRNLVTGTEYMNEQGMLPYAEKAVQNWLIRKANGGRILYRVTPIFSGSELVCRGAIIQAGDVATRGEKFHINVFCYNVEPGIRINYSTGESQKIEDGGA